MIVDGDLHLPVHHLKRVLHFSRCRKDAPWRAL